MNEQAGCAAQMSNGRQFTIGDFNTRINHRIMYIKGTHDQQNHYMRILQ